MVFLRAAFGTSFYNPTLLGVALPEIGLNFIIKITYFGSVNTDHRSMIGSLIGSLIGSITRSEFPLTAQTRIDLMIKG